MHVSGSGLGDERDPEGRVRSVEKPSPNAAGPVQSCRERKADGRSEGRGISGSSRSLGQVWQVGASTHTPLGSPHTHCEEVSW